MKTAFPILFWRALQVKEEEKTVYKTHSYTTQETDVFAWKIRFACIAQPSPRAFYSWSHPPAQPSACLSARETTPAQALSAAKAHWPGTSFLCITSYQQKPCHCNCSCIFFCFFFSLQNLNSLNRGRRLLQDWNKTYSQSEAKWVRWKTTGTTKKTVHVWSNKHRFLPTSDLEGQEHGKLLTSGVCPQWAAQLVAWCDEWQVADPSNCHSHDISISYHGKFLLKRFHPTFRLRISTTKSTVYSDRWLRTTECLAANGLLRDT